MSFKNILGGMAIMATTLAAPVIAADGSLDGVTVNVSQVEGTVTVGGTPLTGGNITVPTGAIATGADGRVALEFFAEGSTPPGDLLVLAPHTSVTLVASGAATDEPVLAEIHHGNYHALGRLDRALFALQDGDRIIDISGTSLIGGRDQVKDSARYYVLDGQAVVRFGHRRIRISEGMARSVVEGKIRGASQMTDLARGRVLSKLVMPGVDVSMPKEPEKVVVRELADDTTTKRALPSQGRTVSGETWKYDMKGDRHWSPIDRQWHPGKPPNTPSSTAAEAGRTEPVFEDARTILNASKPETSTTEKPASKPAVKPAEKPATAPTAEATAPVYVRLTTTLGPITLRLDTAKAPISVANFMRYADEGFYDGTVFHRVMDNFMIQGGGFTDDYVLKPTYDPIQNEWKNGLKNTRGTVAMARQGNKPDSGTCQFFINVKDNGFLDQPRDGAGYAVFGRVVEGMEVVDAIKVVPTITRHRMQNVPVEDVRIEKVERVTMDVKEDS